MLSRLLSSRSPIASLHNNARTKSSTESPSHRADAPAQLFVCSNKTQIPVTIHSPGTGVPPALPVSTPLILRFFFFFFGTTAGLAP